MKTIEHWIGGAGTAGASTRTADVSTRRPGSPGPGAARRPADVDAAVQTATKAFEHWQDASLARRVRILFAFRELVEPHLDELAAVVSDEHGKVISDAIGEVHPRP